MSSFVAFLSGADQYGRWVPEPEIAASAYLGGSTVDLQASGASVEEILGPKRGLEREKWKLTHVTVGEIESILELEFSVLNR